MGLYMWDGELIEEITYIQSERYSDNNMSLSHDIICLHVFIFGTVTFYPKSKRAIIKVNSMTSLQYWGIKLVIQVSQTRDLVYTN